MALIKIVKTASVLLALLIDFVAAPLVHQSQPFHESKGWIKGKAIRTLVDKEVPSIKIIIESAKTKREVLTNKDGSYKIQVPAGVYTITAAVPRYYSYHRAPFRVRPGMITIIDLHLLFDTYVSHRESTKLYYEKLSLPDSTDEELDILVEYESREEADNFIKYNRARLYYDALAVYASDIKMNKKDFTFKATGNVRVDDGQQSDIYVRQADIHFAGSDPIVRLTFGAIDYISGYGSIDDDNVRFEFKIEKGQVGQFIYEDKKLGISFTADIISFGVIDDEAGKVEFIGSAAIKFKGRELVPGSYNPPMGFVVTVQDNGNTGADTFSISIDLDVPLKRSGKLSSGDIIVRRAY